MPAARPPCSGPSRMPLSRQTALAKWTFDPISGKRNSVTTYTMAAIIAIKVMLMTEMRLFSIKKPPKRLTCVDREYILNLFP